MMSSRSILANKSRVEEAINNSSSVKDCLQFLGLRAAGGNYQAFYKWCQEHDLVPPVSDKSSELLRYHQQNARALSEILVQDSSFHRGSLKKRLLREGILQECCEICGIGPKWQGRKLSLQLDHKNGVHDDNRLENLRLLCPNCHSQTPTFAGKRPKYSCSTCQSSISRWTKSGLCRKCAAAVSNFHRRKVQRPPKEVLGKMLWEKPTTQIAQEFNVSDKAIEKWCKAYGLSKPPRGYWQKMLRP